MHPITVFNVYAQTDEVLRQQLEKHLALLRRQNVIAGWQEILAGAAWAEKTEQLFKEAKLILLLISADFLDSDVCYEQQMQRALERERQGEVKVIPILLRPADWKSAPFAHLQVLPTNGKPITSWASEDEAFAHVTEGIRCVLEGKPLPSPASESLAPTTSVKPVWMVPYARNPFFTGRSAVLDDLHQRFKQGQAQVVSQPQAMSGLGGIGKTQIAIEYAYRHRETYLQVLWASAETVEGLTAAYTQMAITLDLPEKGAQEQEIIREGVKRWLAEHQRWLLILDNADALAVLGMFLPPMMGGHILVTTRARDLTMLGLGFGHGLEIETFTAEQGALFLLHRAGLLALDVALDQARTEDLQAAMELSEELGGLPLALDQAGAYLKMTGRDLATYQQIYQAHRRQLLEERRGKEHPDSVATTWKLSFERVETANAAAAELLRLCGFLAPDAIAEWMFTKEVESVDPILALVAADGYLLDQAMETLQAYSLLKRDPRTAMLSMHRLVQVVLRDALTEEEETIWKQRVVLFLSKVCPDVRNIEQWPKCEQWVLHALVSVTWLDQLPSQTEGAALICARAGYYLRERGQYALAESLLEQTLAISKQESGPEHLDTASALNNLAILYYEQGKYVQAEPLYQQALHIREQQLGAEHPDVTTSLNDLANLYQVQGKYAEAETLYLQVLHIREQQLGAEHWEMATSLNNLANLYQVQGMYAETESFYQRALRIREQQLGPEHPDTATSLNNLAGCYYEQGNYAEVELLYQRALSVWEQQLGSQHPRVAISFYNLAELYHKQEEYTKAELFYQQALHIFERKIGAEYHLVAYPLNGLALLSYEQRKYAEAELLYKRALVILEQSLGTGHPVTKQHRRKYVGLLRELGREEEAVALEAEGE